ncbi:MAG: class I SAM-dependent methyltransferase [Acidimicrobiales bacterium]
MTASAERTRASFGYEWTSFDGVHDEDETYWQRYVAGVPLDRLDGLLGLDAGCGMARYSRFSAAHLRHLVCMDASSAAIVAARTLRDVPRTSVVRGDLTEPPFPAESFGFIQSFGVLHHLEDPVAGFHRLLTLLGPGGLMALYVYSRPEQWGVRSVALRAAAVLRCGAVHLPFSVLRVASWPTAVLLYGLVVVPGAAAQRRGRARLASLPLQAYRGKPLHTLWLDTFDRLSAPVEHRYTWADLEPWFRGLTIRHAVEDSGWYVVLEKPSPLLETDH